MPDEMSGGASADVEKYIHSLGMFTIEIDRVTGTVIPSKDDLNARQRKLKEVFSRPLHRVDKRNFAENGITSGIGYAQTPTIHVKF